jgi:hypothetical protein
MLGFLSFRIFVFLAGLGLGLMALATDGAAVLSLETPRRMNCAS